MERKQLDSILLREGEQFITYLIINEKMEKEIMKVIHPKYLQYKERYKRIMEQFQLEKEVLKLLKIKNIPRYIDSGENYLHLSYIAGENLKNYLQKRKVEREEAEKIICSLGEIVSQIHKAGIVHCDISLDNVIYNGRDISLIDFGSVVFSETRGIYVQGTKGFSAPEIYDLSQKRVPQSDIYSLGALCHYLFYGKKYNETEGTEDEILKKALEPKPEDRFENVEQMINTIKNSRRKI